MKKTLFEIREDYLAIIEQVADLEGELTPELIDALKITEGEIQSKAIGYHEFIGSTNAITTRIDAEVKRLTAMKNRNNMLVSNLKERLLEAVKTFGEFEVGLVKFGTRKSSSIQVEDVNSLPTEFKVIKVTESADKANLKEALKEGKNIKGVTIVNNLNLKIS